MSYMYTSTHVHLYLDTIMMAIGPATDELHVHLYLDTIMMAIGPATDDRATCTPLLGHHHNGYRASY